MTLPDVDTNATYAGSLFDYSAPVDPTTDRPAAGANPAYANVAMSTHTIARCWTRFSPQGTGTPILAAAGVQCDAVWFTATPTLPVVARSGVGIYTVTWPTTVQDEIPPGYPGAAASNHNVNLRASKTNVEGNALWFPQSQPTSANVLTVWIFNTSFALADPNGPVFCVWGA